MRNKLAEISHTPPSPEPPCSMRGGAPAQTTDAKTAAPFALVIDDQEDICRLFGTTLTELGIASRCPGNALVAARAGRRTTVIETGTVIGIVLVCHGRAAGKQQQQDCHICGSIAAHEASHE